MVAGAVLHLWIPAFAGMTPEGFAVFDIRLPIAASIVLLIAHMASGTAQEIACHAPLKPMLEIDLMFGRNIGDHLGVGEQDWSDFVQAEITPRFPEGLSVLDVQGQWQDSDTKDVVREPSKDVRLVVPAGPEIDAKVDAVVQAYKQRFQQQSVAVIIRPACVSF